MTDEDDRYLALARQILDLKNQLAEFRVALLAQKVFFLSLQMPDQIEDGLRALEVIEKEVLQADPSRPLRQQVADIVDAFQAIKKRGASEPDS